MSVLATPSEVCVNTETKLPPTPDKKCGYLIDMDGVIYRGNKLIPGSDYFIQSLLEKEIPFLFLTNNSQRSRCDVVLKLANLGINVEIGIFSPVLFLQPVFWPARNHLVQLT